MRVHQRTSCCSDLNLALTAQTVLFLMAESQLPDGVFTMIPGMSCRCRQSVRSGSGSENEPAGGLRHLAACVRCLSAVVCGGSVSLHDQSVGSHRFLKSFRVTFSFCCCFLLVKFLCVHFKSLSSFSVSASLFSPRFSFCHFIDFLTRNNNCPFIQRLSPRGP